MKAPDALWAEIAAAKPWAVVDRRAALLCDPGQEVVFVYLYNKSVPDPIGFAQLRDFVRPDPRCL